MMFKKEEGIILKLFSFHPSANSGKVLWEVTTPQKQTLSNDPDAGHLSKEGSARNLPLLLS